MSCTNAAFRDITEAVESRTPVLLMGPPGTGKTRVARRMPLLMPAMDDHAYRWIAAEFEAERMPHSVFGRPFRAPHYTVSGDALVGRHPLYATSPRQKPACRCRRDLPSHPFHILPRGPVPPAGELQRGRFGVLYLDEVTEFSPTAIRSLALALSRMSDTKPLLVAGARPCACGWDGETGRACECSQESRDHHRAFVRARCDLLGIRRTIRLDHDTADAICRATGDVIAPTTW